jgi:protein gp37
MTDDQQQFNGKIRMMTLDLEKPLKVKKPQVFAVWNDIFHERVTEEFVLEAFGIMALCPQHTFIVLTKRPERMKAFLLETSHGVCVAGALGVMENIKPRTASRVYDKQLLQGWPWPLPNVWLGVTAENQETADERIPILLQIPAAVRFVSIEPMLGPIDLTMIPVPGSKDPVAMNVLNRRSVFAPHIHWVICGGESGPNARPMHPDWVRNLRDQCQEAGASFFFKQWGEFIVPEDGTQTCRVCGCTNNNACIDDFGDGCYWVEPDLCSECVAKPVPEGDRPVKYWRVGKKAAGRILDGREHNDLPWENERS